ncbi:hypothetical protein ACUOFC_53385, partial [Escherichia sp. TWPC-MK]
GFTSDIIASGIIIPSCDSIKRLSGCMVTSAAMYLPFLKAYEKQLLEQENENAVEHAQDAAQSA